MFKELREQYLPQILRIDKFENLLDHVNINNRCMITWSINNCLVKRDIDTAT